MGFPIDNIQIYNTLPIAICQYKFGSVDAFEKGKLQKQFNKETAFALKEHTPYRTDFWNASISERFYIVRR